MRTKMPLFLAACATLALTSACSNAQSSETRNWAASSYDGGRQIIGSDTLVRESRPVAAFSRIRSEGAVSVVVRQGPASDAVIEADDNLVGLVDLVIEHGDTLVVETSGSYRPRNPMRVYVAVPRIEDVAVSGSGDITLQDWRADMLALAVGGSGDIRLDGRVREVHATVAGSGDIDLGGVAVEEASATVAGSGDIRIGTAGTVYATIAGSGDIDAGDVGHLVGSVNGTGDIDYRSAQSVTGNLGR